MEAVSQDRTIRLTGRILATDWDEFDKVVQIGIEPADYDDEYEEYLIDDNELGDELLEMVGKIVTVSGTVWRNEEGALVITVEDYED